MKEAGVDGKLVIVTAHFIGIIVWFAGAVCTKKYRYRFCLADFAFVTAGGGRIAVSVNRRAAVGAAAG